MSFQRRNWFFDTRFVSFAVIVFSVFYLAGCSTTQPSAEPQSARKPVAQSQRSEDANKRFAKAPVSQSSSLDQLEQAKPVGTTPSSPLKDIYFDFDRYDLRADARDTLKANAAWLQHNPATSVQIEGHCDERGISEYNLALGAKRAQMAKDYLVNLGVVERRLSTISYGQELPVCHEHNEECWQKNRHDRFVVKPSPTS